MKDLRNFSRLSALLLVLLLLTIGMAYGYWVDTLNVGGTVHTGEVDVDWTDFDCYDKMDHATISAVLSDDEDTIFVTVEDGYPGYVGHCWANSEVKGTLPVYIKSIDFTPGGNLTGCETNYVPGVGKFTATCQQLQVEWTNGLCSEFAPGVGAGEGSNMTLSVLSGADQNTSYQFTVAYTYEQATAGGCTP